MGMRIPYWTQQIKVKVALDNRTATVGFNPAVPGGVAPLGVPGTPTSPHAPRGACASIDNAGAHATIRVMQAQGLRCSLCRCGGAPVRGVSRLVHRATRRRRAHRAKETSRDPGDKPPEHAALRASGLDL
jgi:hypothetical protein